MSLSVLAWNVSRHYEQRVAEAQFQAASSERALLIKNRLQSITSELEDIASFYTVNDGVTGQQLARFVAPILDRDKAIQALSWNPVVTHAEREAHETFMRAQGNDDYRITHRAANGELVTAPVQEQYVVVSAIEPLKGNENALGFDVMSEPTRRQALERARDSGSLAIAAPLQLVQGESGDKGALAFLPRYSSDSSGNSVTWRRQHLEGYLVAVVHAPKLIAAALSGLEAMDGRLLVTTASPGSAPQTLYDSAATASTDVHVPAEVFAGDASPFFATEFPWGGHHVSVRFDASESFTTDIGSWAPAVLLIAGLMITSLTAAMVSMLGGRTALIAQQVATRTEELRDANDVLQAEVARRIAVEERLAASQKDLEREVAERTTELRSTTNQLRSILESEPECVKILSADGALEEMNAAGLAMIEADSMEQVRGANIYDLIADEHREAFIDLNKRVIHGEAAALEFEIVGLRGTRRWVETHAVPLLDPEGGANRHLAITRDITGRKNAAEEQARLEGQLRHSQKLESIGVMAGGIAHDFNNLLQAVIGNCDIALSDPSLSATAKETLEASRDAAIHASKLCDQMLTYAGKSRPDIQPVHLPQLAESMVDLLKLTLSKKTRLELDVRTNLGLVDGDESQLRQIIMNLITNAAEAIEDNVGLVELTIDTAEITADTHDEFWVGEIPTPGQYVALVVTDSGCGIDAATREKMFDPFFTTKFTGRGLGLSSTLGIIKSHGGYLNVASTPGKGSSITVLLPGSTGGHQSMSESAGSRDESLNATIMIVDDEPAVLKVGARMLESLGCHAVTAADGEDAIEQFVRGDRDIDAVLLDVTMPKLDGKETCAVLRQRRHDLPVIFCSGYADDRLRTVNDSAVFTGFLHKPYRRDELASVLREAIGHGLTTDAGGDAAMQA